MRPYFNEFDRFPAAWLRALYPSAEVDERSIADVGADDLAGRERCHFFAGIGGWEYALELAGWPADWPVWTGSCPCQPFSTAGKGLGDKDPRHLWPEFRRLIALCRPPVVFGEQVASKAGRLWLAGVRADMEALGYAVGAADLCAAGVGAPHIRQRLYWVAYAAGEGAARGFGGEGGAREARGPEPARGRAVRGGLADADHGRREQRDAGQRGVQVAGEDERVDDTTGARCNGKVAVAEGDSRDETRMRVSCAGRTDGRMGHADRPGREEQRGAVAVGEEQPRVERAGAWSSAVYLDCTDGKARRVEPGVRPLAHGVSGRVGRLRGYGNAIVPQVAAAFVSAFMEAVHA